MGYLVLILTITTAGGDSLKIEQQPAPKDYTIDVIINAGISLGFGLSAYYCKNTADNAYEEYKTAKTMEKAVEQWNKVALYDKLTTICGVGSAVFLGRAVYYQLKNIKQRRVGSIVPVLDIRYARSEKIILGVEKKI